MRRWIAAGVALMLAGCAAGPEAKLLGHWTGGFVAEGDSSKTSYLGFLHLYQHDSAFKMELKGKFQTLTALGEWSLEKDRLSLRLKDLQSDRPSDDEMAALKTYFLEVDEVRKQFGKETVLRVTPEGTLAGMPMHLGRTPGRFEFTHAARSSYQ